MFSRLRSALLWASFLCAIPDALIHSGGTRAPVFATSYTASSLPRYRHFSTSYAYIRVIHLIPGQQYILAFVDGRLIPQAWQGAGKGTGTVLSRAQNRPQAPFLRDWPRQEGWRARGLPVPSPVRHRGSDILGMVERWTSSRRLASPAPPEKLKREDAGAQRPTGIYLPWAACKVAKVPLRADDNPGMVDLAKSWAADAISAGWGPVAWNYTKQVLRSPANVASGVRFHGNYCGIGVGELCLDPGSPKGRCLSPTDCLCKAHDLCYSGKEYHCDCDRRLVAGLRKILEEYIQACGDDDMAEWLGGKREGLSEGDLEQDIRSPRAYSNAEEESVLMSFELRVSHGAEVDASDRDAIRCEVEIGVRTGNMNRSVDQKIIDNLAGGSLVLELRGQSVDVKSTTHEPQKKEAVIEENWVTLKGKKPKPITFLDSLLSLFGNDKGGAMEEGTGGHSMKRATTGQGWDRVGAWIASELLGNSTVIDYIGIRGSSGMKSYFEHHHQIRVHSYLTYASDRECLLNLEQDYMESLGSPEDFAPDWALAAQGMLEFFDGWELAKSGVLSAFFLDSRSENCPWFWQ